MKKHKLDPNEFKIAVIDNDDKLQILNDKFETISFSSQITALKVLEKNKFDAIIANVDGCQMDGFKFVNKLLKTLNSNTPYFLISFNCIKCPKDKIRNSNVTDVYHINGIDKLIKRLSISKKVKQSVTPNSNIHTFDSNANFLKRFADISISIIALIIVSPIMILVSLILLLQNKGPIIYRSKRVAKNFDIIDVYKFRTMIVDADKKIDSIKNLNAYSENLEVDVSPSIKKSTLMNDSMSTVEEQDYLNEVRNTPVFLKFKADPRVTTFGKILRKTSIDELPQLFNIIKGDISLVGNRPLPIPEGDKLTTDEAISRFLAPAGLTGYWQVTQRGTSDISQKDRIEMDNYYSMKRSFWLDVKIIFKTFKALIQNENH